MNIIDGDVIEVVEEHSKTGSALLVHQVNCVGVMGGGVAKAIRDKWPVVYAEYRKSRWDLGDIQIVLAAPNVHVCNLAGQYEIYGPHPLTDYKALEKGLRTVAGWNSLSFRVFLPYLIGCGLGGGDWKIVLPLIEKYLPEATLVRLPE